MKYIVEIDTKYVSIYHKGLILRQPSYAVVEKLGAYGLVAAGEQCFSHVGKIRETMSIINPVKGGSIVNLEVAALMFENLFKRVIPKSLFKNIEIVAPISAGLSMVERENFENALIKTGYPKITLIESLVGLVPYADKRGQAVINIGYGTTEIGVVHEGGIIEACSVDLGCDAIEKKISEAIADKYNVKILQSHTEALRKELATLRENDKSGMEVMGRDLLSGQNTRVKIEAQDIRPVVEKCYSLLFEVAESLITTIPLKLIQPVTSKGLYICGAGALISGLAQYVKGVFGLNVTIPNDPETAVMRGLFTADR
jgi:rod shape-determining protein MreB